MKTNDNTLFSKWIYHSNTARRRQFYFCIIFQIYENIAFNSFDHAEINTWLLFFHSNKHNKFFFAFFTRNIYKGYINFLENKFPVTISIH